MPEKLYVTLKGIVVEDGKALILECEDPRGQLSWDFPGGRIDEGETPQQALTREVEEELPGSSNLKIGEYLHSYRYTIPYKDGISGFCVVYAITLDLPRVRVSAEHSGYYWISKDEVPDREEFRGRRLSNERKQAILAALS